MPESKNTSQQRHGNFLLQVAQKVDQLLSMPGCRDCFRSRLKDLSKKVDAYEQSQSGGQTRQSVPNPLEWFPPHTFLNEYDPNSPSQKQPNEDEKLMICYIILAIVHDKALRDPQYERILFDLNSKGDHFFLDAWVNSLWKYLSDLRIYNQTERERYATRIRAMIKHAFERVKDSLSSKKPAETEQKTTTTKFQKIGAWLWKLYEVTLKSFWDAFWDKVLHK